jgi:hypothetical protein
MKTPKEIAIELVNKHKRCLAPYLQEQSILIKSKQCALIAVDEIIKYSPNKPDYESDPIEYFNKVKNEIENL